MGYLFTWIGLTLLTYAAWNLQRKAMINAKLRERKKEQETELDYITKKGL